MDTFSTPCANLVFAEYRIKLEGQSGAVNRIIKNDRYLKSDLKKIIVQGKVIFDALTPVEKSIN